MTIFKELERKQAAESFLQKVNNLKDRLGGAKQIVDQLVVYRDGLTKNEIYTQEDLEAIDQSIDILARESLVLLKQAFEGTETLKGTIVITFKGSEIV